MTARRILERPDRDEVLAAMTELSDRVAALMDAVTDWDARVHGSPEWTVTDLLRHMSLLPELYSGTSVEVPQDRAPSAAAMAETNRKAMAAVAHRGPEVFAQVFRDNVPVLLDHLRTSDPDAGLPFHAGLTLTPAELGSVTIGEWLIHGHDLAATLGMPWRMQRRHAGLVLAGFNAVLPAWVDPSAARGHSGTYEIRLRGTGERLCWTFTDGAFSARPGPDFRADTIVWADPAVLLLVFYGRLGLWGGIARGAMLAGGRKPLRALRLKEKFYPA